MNDGNIRFATYVESIPELANACRMTESLRTFGGRFARKPVSVYAGPKASEPTDSLRAEIAAHRISLSTVEAPPESLEFFYATKVYAAARAEQDAVDLDTLVWLDNDTIIIGEPSDLALGAGRSLAYCPVMHNRSGVRYESEPDEFWSRIYRLLGLTDDMLFPMVTPADRQKIKAYFHCGLLAVQPRKGVLHRWLDDFEKLYHDPELIEMCRTNVTNRIFLHQTALTGAVLNVLDRNELFELPERYNYPIFFERQFEAARKFDRIDDVVTVRHVVSEDNLGPDWHRELCGPSEKVAWLYERITGSEPG